MSNLEQVGNEVAEQYLNAKVNTIDPNFWIPSCSDTGYVIVLDHIIEGANLPRTKVFDFFFNHENRTKLEWRGKLWYSRDPAEFEGVIYWDILLEFSAVLAFANLYDSGRFYGEILRSYFKYAGESAGCDTDHEESAFIYESAISDIRDDIVELECFKRKLIRQKRIAEARLEQQQQQRKLANN